MRVLVIIGVSSTFNNSFTEADCRSVGFDNVLRISDMETGLKSLSEIRPDTALVFDELYDQTGTEFIKRAKETEIPTRFVMISDKPSFNLARDAFRCGVSDIFILPFEKNSLMACLRELSDSTETTEILHENYDSQFATILQYIDKHCFEKIRLEDIGELVGFNKNYVCHLFKKQLGMTFIEYLTNKRMKYACMLLETTYMNVETIASKCGFDDSAYFNRVFKKVNGMTPINYRKRVIQK